MNRHGWTALRLVSYAASSYLLSSGMERAFLGMHSWRQCHNAMVARNFGRHGWDPTLTLVDFGGGEMLYGANAPVLAYPTALLWQLTGVETPLVPRMLALLATLTAALLLERLGREIGGRVYGLAAALLFLQIPLICGYGPSFLDDTVMLAAMGGTVYGAYCWGRKPGWLVAVAAALALALALAIKPQAALIALPAGVAAVGAGRGGARALLNPQVAVAAVLAVAAGGLWYALLAWRAHTWPDVLMAFSAAPGSDKWGQFALLADPATSVLLSKRITQEVTGYSGLALVGLGLLCLRRGQVLAVPLAWAGAMALHVVLVLGGHVAHDYYQLALAQPAALLMAGAFLPFSPLLDRDHPVARQTLSGAPAVVGVVLAVVMAVELQPFRHFLRTWEDPRWAPFAAAVAAASGEDESILVIDHSLPEVFYLADRRGYHLTPDEATPEAVAAVEDEIATVAVLEPGRLWDTGHPGLLYLLQGWIVVDQGDPHMILRRSEGVP